MAMKAFISKARKERARIRRRPVLVKKPIKELTADFKALSKLLLSCINSPMRAPKKGPIIMNTIFPVRAPTNTPMVDPHEPAFDPPAFFVKYPGIKLVATSTAIVMAPVIIRSFHDILRASTK